MILLTKVLPIKDSPDKGLWAKKLDNMKYQNLKVI